MTKYRKVQRGFARRSSPSPRWWRRRCGSDSDNGQRSGTTTARRAAAPADDRRPGERRPRAGRRAATGAARRPARIRGRAAAQGQRRRSTARPIGDDRRDDSAHRQAARRRRSRWLECELESCPRTSPPGIKDATEALGWDLKVIRSKSADPGPGVPAGDRRRGSTTSPAPATRPRSTRRRSTAAKAKGIKVLSCFDTDDPDPEATSTRSAATRRFVEKTGPLMADWAIVDSGGTANVLIVSIPDFAGAQGRDRRLQGRAREELPRLQARGARTSRSTTWSAARCRRRWRRSCRPTRTSTTSSTPSATLPGGVTSALETAGLLDQVKQYGQDFATIDLRRDRRRHDGRLVGRPEGATPAG